ncbi:hypothetical protein [Chryseobacterium arthrosphaerae]|uniref:hypothetical protein n=1 Tax=Chryseobacterium arthrosphaerae TaxID=651561 RepID=UPI0031DC8317
MENKTIGAPVENTPSQTLFRFVSLRSPELSDDTKQDKRFITVPDELKSDNAFYVPVVNGIGPKDKLLKARATNYASNADCISNELNSQNNLKEFKITYNAYYTFGAWLAKNKNTCTYEEVIEKRAILINPNAAPERPRLIDLWNNLIYQTVTQKDFYIKEVVMQQLLVQHVISVSNEEEMKASLGARVVLPKELMLDNESLQISIPTSKMAAVGSKETYPTEEMKKQQLISTAKIKLRKYEALKKNLSAIERVYKAEYQSAYKEAEVPYKREVAAIIEQYNTEIAGNRDKYCQIRNSEIKYDPADPCQQIPKIPDPVFPKFDFQFRPEIEAEQLLGELKSDNVDALFDILGHDFQANTLKERAVSPGISDLENLLEGRNSFSEINSLLTQAIEKAHNTVVENTEPDNETYTSIGGILVPVAKWVAVPFTYQVCAKFIYKGYSFDMALTVPDSSWEVDHISYTLIPGNGTASITSDYHVKSRSGNTIFLNDLCMPGLDFYTIQNAELNTTVVFTNGNKANIYTHGLQARSCVSDKFLLEVEMGEPEVTDEENTFIPSGFGFKQIGIADYLKVEQSTHAYVEGEVAHIENIMAREYREKSTRRLRRSENTSTKSSDTEREQLSDTTTANRFEMQNEISRMMQESNDFAGFANANYNGGGTFSMSVGANYANHRSKDESTRQAVSQAQDITARAMDRIVTKVHEERIEKIIDEFEENNSHGLDNRKGDKHVVGVYRWVDKLMKNQIYNYGKRMMFEFMIPEPAKLHLLGMAKSKFVKPEDPRTSAVMPMKDFSALENDMVFKYWTGKYNVEIEDDFAAVKNIGYSFSEKVGNNVSANNESAFGRFAGVYNKDFKVPENYMAIHISGDVKIRGGSWLGSHSFAPGGILSINNQKIIQGTEGQFATNGSYATLFNLSLDNVEENVGLTLNTWDINGVSGSVLLTCALTPSYKLQRQQKMFKAIIDAYEVALFEYNNMVSEEKNKAVAIKDSNPNFYRKIENTILRKNCISYMADRAVNSTHGYGLSGLTQGSAFTDYETKLSKDLDKYTAFVKFMEQAFEWENLSYYLYPYYWGNKENWEMLYQSENTDPLFGAFLQSGMARVVATVRPGFEDAVQFYMATGKIWNGGEVPVIGDELYLSIVDEMKQPKGVKQGKAWITRLPTTLNILQAESIGLKVAHALPFTTENPDDFEIPGDVITEDKFNFEKNDSVLGGSTSGEKWIQLSFNGMDKTTNFDMTIGDLNHQIDYPRVYKCMDKTIQIDRDASWKDDDSILKYYNILADEVSKIDGIQAFPSGVNGLIFRIDVNKVKNFKFEKPMYETSFDILEFVTDAKSYLRVYTPDLSIYSNYGKVLDKEGTKLNPQDFGVQIPLSRFLI